MNRRVTCLLAALFLTLTALPAPAHEPSRPARHRPANGEVANRAYHFFLEGRTLFRRGYLDAAAEQLELACQLAPREGRYHLYLAKVLRSNGEPKGAVMHLRMAYESEDEQVKEEAFKLLEELGAPAEPKHAKPMPPSALGKEDTRIKSIAVKSVSTSTATSATAPAAPNQ